MSVSLRHPFVRRCRDVAADRERGDVVLLDGEHLVADALDAGVAIDGVLTDGRAETVVARAAARGVAIHRASASVLAAASPVRSPSGIVALARWAPRSVDEVLSADQPLVVGLAGVQDPGNAGGIIRSAEALGATGVLALDGTADPGGWKALRGAMGSTFRLAVGRGTLTAALAAARARGVRIVATVPSGGVPPGTAALTGPLLVLVGSEGAGLAGDVVSAADLRITIPMRGAASSLNVGVAAAVILWEANKTRPRP
jgi:TrmH family RNA methyltransferase